MENNIELRSESIRNIIGQIPPFIIRVGVSIILIILILLFSLGYFLKYPYKIKTTIEIENEDSMFVGLIKISASEFNNIRIGDKVIISFKEEYSCNSILINHIDSISNEIIITEKNTYCSAFVYFQDELVSSDGYRLQVHLPIVCNVMIITNPNSFFDRMFANLKLFLESDK